MVCYASLLSRLSKKKFHPVLKRVAIHPAGWISTDLSCLVATAASGPRVHILGSTRLNISQWTQRVKKLDAKSIYLGSGKKGKQTNRSLAGLAQ
jgi:hypothetical protein